MAKTVVINGQQRWDYRSETRRTDASLVVTLNELGQQGWEAINVLFYKDVKGEMAWTAVLKRPSAGSATGAPQQSGVLTASPLGGNQDAPTTADPKGFDLSGTEFGLKFVP